jgi:hypothetical protein
MNFDKAMNDCEAFVVSTFGETIRSRLIDGDKLCFIGLIPLLKRNCVEEITTTVNVFCRMFIDIIPLKFDIIIADEDISVDGTNFKDIFIDIMGDLIKEHDKLWS